MELLRAAVEELTDEKKAEIIRTMAEALLEVTEGDITLEGSEVKKVTKEDQKWDGKDVFRDDDGLLYYLDTDGEGVFYAILPNTEEMTYPETRIVAKIIVWTDEEEEEHRYVVNEARDGILNGYDITKNIADCTSLIAPYITLIDLSVNNGTNVSYSNLGARLGSIKNFDFPRLEKVTFGDLSSNPAETAPTGFFTNPEMVTTVPSLNTIDVSKVYEEATVPTLFTSVTGTLMEVGIDIHFESENVTEATLGSSISLKPNDGATMPRTRDFKFKPAATLDHCSVFYPKSLTSIADDWPRTLDQSVKDLFVTDGEVEIDYSVY